MAEIAVSEKYVRRHPAAYHAKLRLDENWHEVTSLLQCWLCRFHLRKVSDAQGRISQPKCPTQIYPSVDVRQARGFAERRGRARVGPRRGVRSLN